MTLRLMSGRDLPRVRPPMWLVGLDLGQRRDWTALAIVRRTETLRANPDPGKSPRREGAYDVLHLDRTRETSYEAVVDRVIGVLRRPELTGARFVLDETGVGNAVADMFEARGIAPERVTITGGIDATSSGSSHRVPKRDLASAVEVLLETRRLAIAEVLPLAQVLTSELANFRVKVSPAGHDSYGAGADWRENAHDDLVLAVALAVWLGEQPSRELLRARA